MSPVQSGSGHFRLCVIVLCKSALPEQADLTILGGLVRLEPLFAHTADVAPSVVADIVRGPRPSMAVSVAQAAAEREAVML